MASATKSIRRLLAIPSLQNQLEALAYRDDFYEFVRAAWPVITHEKPVWNWHIPYLCKELQTVAERVFEGKPAEYTLIINQPPGTTKSIVASICLPIWCWVRMPSLRTICGSYTHFLALDLSRKSRDIVKSEWFRDHWPSLSLRKDQDSKGYFANNSGGMRYAVGVCGSVLGLHGHVLCADDPVDPLQVLSEADLKTVHHWMTHILPSRKVDKLVSTMILVQQRLHENDSTGYLLASGLPIKHICLPAELTEDVKPSELREFYIDGLLDPIRMPREILLREKLRLGDYGYASQFLQKPYPVGGGLFKEAYFIHRRASAPYKAMRLRYWDLAATAAGLSNSACNTAGTLLSRDDNGDWFVENVVVGQWEPRERLENIKAVALRDRVRYGPHQEPDIYLEHEGGSSGVDAFKYAASYLAGFRVHPDRPTGDKEARARPVAAQCAAGNVYIVEDGSWDIPAWIKELCAFPNARLKDRVDSFSGAFNKLLQKPMAGTLKVFNVRPRAKDSIRIMVCNRQQLACLQVEEQALLIHLLEPLKVGEEKETKEPPHGLTKLLDKLFITFADISPETMQDRWQQPMEAYGCLPSEVVLTREHCKKLWAFILRKRDVPWQTLVLCDDTLNKALSLAIAYCKTTNWATTIIDHVGEEGTVGDKAPNAHIYDLFKSTRGMVV